MASARVLKCALKKSLQLPAPAIISFIDTGIKMNPVSFNLIKLVSKYTF